MATGAIIELSTGGAVEFNVGDDLSPAFQVLQGSEQYLQIDTTNGSENVSIGDASVHGRMQIDPDGHVNWGHKDSGQAGEWSVKTASLTTTSGSQTQDIFTIGVSADSVIYIRAVVLARDTTDDLAAGFVLEAFMQRVAAGNVEVVNGTVSSNIHTSLADPPWQLFRKTEDSVFDAIISTSTTSVTVQVTGDATNNTDWSCRVEFWQLIN